MKCLPKRPASGLRALTLGLTCASASWLLAGCELTEVEVALPDEAVLAEVYLFVEADGGGAAVALLHQTLSGSSGTPLTGVPVRLTVEGRGSRTLPERALAECVDLEPPPGFRGVCYRWEDPEGTLLAPGRRAQLAIDLPGGGQLEGRTTIPGDFRMIRPAADRCVLAEDRVLPLEWSPAPGSWAYVGETRIHRLREVLEPEGIPAGPEPLLLLGLAISATDTTLVFPAEFGLFDRFQDDGGLLLRLQRGLPDGSWATVDVTATDRNYANWIRGGSFNPSGLVRVPSVFGDGTGVFGSAVVRRVTVGTPGAPNQEPGVGTAQHGAAGNFGGASLPGC